MLKKITYRAGAVILALSFLWIFTYALIEFHQKYVFHKYSEWVQFHLVKTGEKNLKKNLKSYTVLQKNNKCQDFKSGILYQDLLAATPLATGINLLQIPTFTSLSIPYNTGPALRAPPAL